MKSLDHLFEALLAQFATVLLISCATPGAPMPPSLELPKPVADLRAVRKGDQVFLGWTIPAETTDRLPVRYLGPTRICRTTGSVVSGCDTVAGEISALPPTARKGAAPAPKIEAGYADTLPPAMTQNADGVITYAVQVLNSNRRAAGLSNPVQVSAAPTLPPPQSFQAQVTGDGVALTWKALPEPPAPPGLRHKYRVYRRLAGRQEDSLVGELPFGASAEARMIDHDFQWQTEYAYRATVVTVVERPGQAEIEVEGEDTPAINLRTNDVFPPSVPEGLQAVFSGEGQQPFVDLIWAPDTDADLAGYNIYRREGIGRPAKINPELAKLPAYRDANLQSGKKYFYAVRAVDVRGNESALSPETSEEVP